MRLSRIPESKPELSREIELKLPQPRIRFAYHARYNQVMPTHVRVIGTCGNIEFACNDLAKFWTNPEIRIPIDPLKPWWLINMMRRSRRVANEIK